MNTEMIRSQAQTYLNIATDHRRALHRIPEIHFDLPKTHAYLMQELQKLQPDDLRVFAGVGIRAVFYGNGEGRTVAFRSDMDALPVEEQTGREFKSEHEGCMHACGHDGHMAGLLTLATWVRDHKSILKDNVVLIFQPAEETTGGALPMIEEGVLENPKVDIIYGLHMMPDVPKGHISCKSGPLMAQTCEMDILIHGKSAHGAMPHLGCDAIAAMGYLITLMQSTVSRRINPCEPALITVGKVSGGKQRNVIADEVCIEGIVRTYSNSIYEEVEKGIRADMKAVEETFGVQCEFIKRVYYPCVHNDETAFENVRKAAGDCFMPESARTIAEDFAYYQLNVPGAFFFLGCKDEQYSSPLHASTFDFDESALLTGLTVFANLVEYTE